MGLDDSTFMSLGTQCPNLQHLCVGLEGEQESIYSQEDYYCNFLTDQGLISLVRSCLHLKYASARALFPLSWPQQYWLFCHAMPSELCTLCFAS